MFDDHFDSVFRKTKKTSKECKLNFFPHKISQDNAILVRDSGLRISDTIIDKLESDKINKVDETTHQIALWLLEDLANQGVNPCNSPNVRGHSVKRYYIIYKTQH